MLKKFLLLVLSVICCFCLAVGFSACSGNQGADNDDDNEQSSITENENNETDTTDDAGNGDNAEEDKQDDDGGSGDEPRDEDGSPDSSGGDGGETQNEGGNSDDDGESGDKTQNEGDSSSEADDGSVSVNPFEYTAIPAEKIYINEYISFGICYSGNEQFDAPVITITDESLYSKTYDIVNGSIEIGDGTSEVKTEWNGGEAINGNIYFYALGTYTVTIYFGSDSAYFTVVVDEYPVIISANSMSYNNYDNLSDGDEVTGYDADTYYMYFNFTAPSSAEVTVLVNDEKVESQNYYTEWNDGSLTIYFYPEKISTLANNVITVYVVKGRSSASLTVKYVSRFIYNGQARLDNIISYLTGCVTMTSQILTDLDTVKVLFMEEITSDWDLYEAEFLSSYTESSFEYNFGEGEAWKYYYLKEGLISVITYTNVNGNIEYLYDSNGKYFTTLDYHAIYNTHPTDLGDEMEAALTEANIQAAMAKYDITDRAEAIEYVKQDTAIQTVYEVYTSLDVGMLNIIMYWHTGEAALDAFVAEARAEYYSIA